jgi:hypothetical protein
MLTPAAGESITSSTPHATAWQSSVSTLASPFCCCNCSQSSNTISSLTSCTSSLILFCTASSCWFLRMDLVISRLLAFFHSTLSHTSRGTCCTTKYFATRLRANKLPDRVYLLAGPDIIALHTGSPCQETRPLLRRTVAADWCCAASCRWCSSLFFCCASFLRRCRSLARANIVLASYLETLA